ncbi:MAG: hypothetical protein LBR89_04655 [Holosporales bacterium]|jgi:hypothetical protein|nr:hypothetical protein [Holosporales bacterium]
MNTRLLFPLIITLACNSYSAGTRNPECREEPRTFQDLEDRVAVYRCRPSILYAGLKNDVPYLMWSKRDILSGIAITHGVPGVRVLPLGDPSSFAQVCDILTAEDRHSLAVHLATIFNQTIIDIKEAREKGTYFRYFVPSIEHIFIQTDSEKSKYRGVVVPISRTMKDNLPSSVTTAAPEGDSCTEASVVYAYGVILASIISKTLPACPVLGYERCPINKEQRRDLINKITPLVQEPIKNLISSCVEDDPVYRPTFSYILRKLREVGVGGFESLSDTGARLADTGRAPGSADTERAPVSAGPGWAGSEWFGLCGVMDTVRADPVRMPGWTGVGPMAVRAPVRARSGWIGGPKWAGRVCTSKARSGHRWTPGQAGSGFGFGFGPGQAGYGFGPGWTGYGFGPGQAGYGFGQRQTGYGFGPGRVWYGR